MAKKLRRPLGVATTNPELIEAQNENMRLRLHRQLLWHRDHERAEIERLKRENERLRKEIR